MLQTLVGDALLSHPALRGQQGINEAAVAGVEGAKWQFYPTPSVALERTGSQSNDPIYRGDKQVVTAGLRQPLWTGGRLTSNLTKARGQALGARADLEITRQQLALRVIQAWSEALSTHKKSLAWAQSRAIHERLLAMVERRASEGASALADVALARSRLAGVNADRLLAQAQRDSALERLRLLIGGRRLAIESLELEWPPLDEARNPERWLEDARAVSPQILKSRAMAQVAEAEVEAARAALSPEVSLRLERQWGSYNTVGAGSQNRIFVAVSTAFGGGLSSAAGINAAQARSRAAQEDIRTQQLSIDEQIQNDIVLWRAN
jgi:adhesin transport system outer membrane protein